MNFSIEFNSKYKHYIIDNIKIRFRSFIQSILLAIFLFFISMYLINYKIGRVITWNEILLAYILYALCIILILISPFIFLFIKINKSLKGDIKMIFTKQENGEYLLNVIGMKSNKEFQSKEIINTITIYKSYYKIYTRKGNDYYVPKRVLNISINENLTSLKKEIDEYRIEETKNKR